MPTFIVLLSALCLLSSSVFAVTEYVYNGGFELYYPSGDPYGWRVSGGEYSYVYAATVEYIHSGNYALVATTNSAPYTLYQYLDTITVGTIYRLSFYLRQGEPDKGQGAQQNSIIVNLSGVQVLDLVNEPADSSWHYYQFDVQATYPDPELSFAFLNTVDNWYLDDVSVVDIPLPDFETTPVPFFANDGNQVGTGTMSYDGQDFSVAVDLTSGPYQAVSASLYIGFKEDIVGKQLPQPIEISHKQLFTVSTPSTSCGVGEFISMRIHVAIPGSKKIAAWLKPQGNGYYYSFLFDNGATFERFVACPPTP